METRTIPKEARLNILIADNAPLIRERMATLVGALPEVGAVLESSDYASTLATIRNERPDVVLLDLFMPGGTGLDVLRSIANEDPRPRVIFLSAWFDEELRRYCLELGAEYIFSKNSDFLDAVEAVSCMHRGSEP